MAGADDGPPLRRRVQRQTPVGRHIPDFVSFVHRIAIEMQNAGETDVIAAIAPRERRGWSSAATAWCKLSAQHHQRSCRRADAPRRRAGPAGTAAHPLMACSLLVFAENTSPQPEPEPMKRDDLTEKLLDIKREKHGPGNTSATRSAACRRSW